MNKHPVRPALRTFALWLAVLIPFLPYAQAAPKVLWQIGSFDNSSGEFNYGKPGPPFFGEKYPKELLYIVGKSNPHVDWPARQLGSAFFQPGSHPRPYTIQFDLDEIPQGVYTFKVALLSENACVGQMQVEINGHVGFYYQHPKLSYDGGDREMIVSPIAGTDTILVDIPAQYLQKGANKFVLTAVDEPSEAVGDVHSALVFDALELDHDSTRKFAADEMSTEVVPTVFYVRQESGLAEIVDVFVRHNAPVQHGQIILTVGGQTYSEEMPARGFGEHRSEFSVPEFAVGTKALVTVKADGHSRRFPVELTPARKWNLLVVPHVHVDVGYSDYQEKVAEIQSRELDEAIDFIREHPAFRFSPDGYWSARQYLAGRSAARQQQLFQMVRDKKIFIPTVEASLLTGFPSLETLIRSLYPAFAFHQKYGGDADYANITDVPSYSWSYASVMAAAGLKYFASGCDNDNGPIILYSRLNEKSPFWWEGPDGGRILMWYSWVYSQLSYLFGGYQGRVASGRESMGIFLQAYSRPEYKSDSVLVYGSQSENTDLFPRQAAVADDWNHLYAYPHLQYSGFADAIRTIAGQFGDSLPVVKGDGGPYWEYGIESTARSAAIDRESEQRALAAEIFSTVGGIVNPGLRTEPETLKRLWNNMVLYAEHTWGSDRSVSDPQSQETRDQLAVKEAFATDAQRDVNYVLRRSLAGLGDSIYEPKGTLLVFNPLSWQRSSLAEMDLDKGREIVDLVTHRTANYEVLYTGEAFRRVRFLAEDVPAVGYKAYELKPTKEEQPAPPAATGETIENPYYRVALDAASGAVRSIFDKELNKELVNASSPYRFDQYVYVTGGDKSPNRILEFSPTAPIPELTPHGASGGKIVSITHEPF